MQILLANPRGFCAGVDRAIEIVERALELFGPPIYVRHEVVHNRFVVDGLKAKGAVFVEELDEVPDGATVVFSAHGVPPAVEAEARRRGLQVFDATCPLVTKVHLEVVRHARAGRDVVLIGHAGHPEVVGTMGQYDASAGGAIHLVETVEDVARLVIRNPDELGFVTQTTLSMDDAHDIVEALKRRFPAIGGARKEDICYATQSRQDAVKQFAEACEVVLVVGSRNSSNSNRLREVAERRGSRAYLIDSAADIRSDWFDGVRKVGVTAGASAPELLVTEVIARLEALGGQAAEQNAESRESVVFSLPRELKR
jgi:4-hydroxy-3-methylbut-2-enyl diphosphate reductase